MPVHEKTRYGHIRLCLYRVVELFLPLYGFHTCTAMLTNVCHNAKNILETTYLFMSAISIYTSHLSLLMISLSF